MTYGDDERRELTSVGDLIDTVVGSALARAGGTASVEIFAGWDEISGTDWRAATPIRLEGSRLLVEVESPTAATRLRYSTADLISRISARVGTGAVTEVRVRLRRPTGRV